MPQSTFKTNKMEDLKFNIYVKLAIITFIALILIASVSMVSNLAEERQNLQTTAINDISSKWGNAQTVSGPVLSIPYYRYEKQVQEDKSVKYLKYKEYIHILPETLDINGEVFPEAKHRNIYETVVYKSKLTIKGNFKNIDVGELNINPQNILWDKAILTMGISDLRGIENELLISLNDTDIMFNPGSAAPNLIYSGVNIKFPEINPEEETVYNFSLNISLKGSQQLYFVPAGKTTEIHLNSPWQNPSFNGAFLPSPRTVDKKGFTADWKVLNLNRNFPQMWTNEQYNFNNSAFGVDLLLPVDNYQKIMRSIKYAVLFIVFTFITFFFTEVLKKKFIHPVQYILVGAALVIFYILLLSITEQLSFNTAFFISAGATLALISAYIRAILKSTPLMLMITGILAVLYTFIFVIIQMQDYSLLIGSIGLFLILALIMLLSRKVDWYEINLGKNKEIDKTEKNEQE